ncbi:MAG: putative toxin-antitoxin system toxin component, PIN family [Solobacterium sp.]|nr:putative toxin-antitoxin system toxin component, PIN family [Solobacterium sp.]
MKVMIDTNVIISAALNPNSVSAASMYKALTYPYEPIVCDYIIDELHRKFEEKFHHKLIELEAFLYQFEKTVRVVKTPRVKNHIEGFVRDPKDQPIIRAAIHAKVDILLTGDKDFLESGITSPRIMNPREFLSL